jgi:hypothetical protein
MQTREEDIQQLVAAWLQEGSSQRIRNEGAQVKIDRLIAAEGWPMASFLGCAALQYAEATLHALEPEDVLSPNMRRWARCAAQVVRTFGRGPIRHRT